MSAKQDIPAVRTAAELQNRYNMKSFGDAMGIATDARRTAEDAMAEASACRSQIIELADSITLEVTGGEAGNTASIVLKVGDQEYSGEINLKGLVTFESLQEAGTTQINGDNIVSEGVDNNGDPVRLTLQGGTLLIDRKGLTDIFSTVLELMVRDAGVRFKSHEGLEIGGSRDSYFGTLISPTYLQGSTVNIKGKECYWAYESDGYYVLKGRD